MNIMHMHIIVVIDSISCSISILLLTIDIAISIKRFEEGAREELCLGIDTVDISIELYGSHYYYR